MVEKFRIEKDNMRENFRREEIRRKEELNQQITALKKAKDEVEDLKRQLARKDNSLKELEQRG